MSWASREGIISATITGNSPTPPPAPAASPENRPRAAPKSVETRDPTGPAPRADTRCGHRGREARQLPVIERAVRKEGRSSRTRPFKMVIPRCQPIRSAITVVGIRGCSDNNRRISPSKGSTNEGRGWRLNSGGESKRTAARTVFLDTPSRRTISLIDDPSAR